MVEETNETFDYILKLHNVRDETFKRQLREKAIVRFHRDETDFKNLEWDMKQNAGLEPEHIRKNSL